MLAGDEFPPVDVFFDSKAYYLADGFHRIQAAMRAKIEAFQCTVHPGGADDALWFAIGANRKNGLQRTAGDKRRAIELALEKFPIRTQEQIASHVGCAQSYVATVASQLISSDKLKFPPTRKGKDGRSRPTKYKSRENAKSVEAAPVTPVSPPRPPPPPKPATPAKLTRNREDFSAKIKTQFAQWMEQWAAADLPRVRSILREMLKE